MTTRLQAVLAWISRSDEDWEFDEDGDLPFLFVWDQSTPTDLVDELADYLGDRDLRLETVHDQSGDGHDATTLYVDGAAHPVPLEGSWRDPFLTVMALTQALQADFRVYVDRDDLHQDALDMVFLSRADAEAMETRYPTQVAQRLLPLRPGDDLLGWVTPGAGIDAPADPELAAAHAALREAARAQWNAGLPGRLRMVAAMYRHFRNDAAAMDARRKHDPATVNALAERLREQATHPAPARPDPIAHPAIPTVVETSPWWKFW